MHSHAMRRFKNCHLARMSDGHYGVIRDLGPVKGGKGLKHHEVVVNFTWQAFVRFVLVSRRRKALQTLQTETRSGRPNGQNTETAACGGARTPSYGDPRKVRNPAEIGMAELGQSPAPAAECGQHDLHRRGRHRVLFRHARSTTAHQTLAEVAAL